MRNYPSKDPNEVLNYDVDWTDRIGASDTILTSNIVATIPAGVVIDSQSYAGKKSTMIVSGGTSGQTAIFTATITTGSGLTLEEVVALPILDNAALPAWPPSAAEFLTRFPEFLNVNVATIAAVIQEAAPNVGENWIERDRRPAVLYLTAHKLASAGYGLGAGGSVPGTAAVLGTIKRRKVGDVEVEFSGVASGGGSGGGSSAGAAWKSTWYGAEYYLLMRRNFTPIAVV